MKNLYSILTILAMFNTSNIIASELQSDTEINPFFRQYKSIDESDVIKEESINEDDTDESDGNYGFYYGDKALREINNKYNTDKANYDNKTIIKQTNELITNNKYKQLQKINNSWLMINYYLNELNSLEVNVADIADIKIIISNITKNYLSNDVTKDMLDIIQELYESYETSDTDKSKLFEIFNNIKEIRKIINTYITDSVISDYELLAIDSYNNKISNNISNIQSNLTQLTEQIAKKLNDIPNKLLHINNIIPNINKLMDKYCKATDLFYQNNNNEEIKNYFRRIVFNIDDIIQSIGYYFQ